MELVFKAKQDPRGVFNDLTNYGIVPKLMSDAHSIGLISAGKKDKMVRRAEKMGFRQEPGRKGVLWRRGKVALWVEKFNGSDRVVTVQEA